MLWCALLGEDGVRGVPRGSRSVRLLSYKNVGMKKKRNLGGNS
jgi:hypothetical protein